MGGHLRPSLSFGDATGVRMMHQTQPISVTMDDLTVSTYTRGADHFAQEWLAQPAPTDMYELLREYFAPGGSTVDIGCGAGRDTAWLNEHGFPTIGYDPSPGLIEQARMRYPSLAFEQAALPELEGVASGAFDNVLCETVIMHLPVGELARACDRLLDLVRPGGVLYLSWRVTEGGSVRDVYDRLYSSFDASVVMASFEGQDVLWSRESASGSSGKRVHRLIVRRAAASRTWSAR